MRRLPPLNALRAFEATARHSSVTAAAHELGVTHSAVSQQIKHLEGYLGQKLFDRPGRRVQPTPAALAFLSDIRPAFDSIAIAAEQLARRGGRRIVTISVPPTLAMRWLIPKIANLQREHPRIELRVSTTQSSLATQLEANDLVVSRQIDTPKGYARTPLLDDDATPVLHPDHARKQKLSHWAQLKECTLLHTRSQPDAWKRWLTQNGVGSGETLDGPYFDNAALALQATLSGLGVALAPMAFVQDELATGRLVAPFPDRVLTGPAFVLTHRPTARDEFGTREVLRWLEREARAPARPLAAG